MVAYGDDDEFLKEYIQSLPTATCFVELVEVFRRPGERSDISQTKFTQLEPLAEHLTKKVPEEQNLQVLIVKQLSGPLLRFLGQKYDMDYELWKCRFQSSDREWFAGPLRQGGARFFSHFNLSTVDFKRETPSTPASYRQNRKLGHTVRLVRLLDVATPGDKVDPSVFIIRRIAGHLRRDGHLWTFLYFCDPYVDMREANFVSHIPGKAQPPLESWMDAYIGTQTSPAFIDDLCEDGFGFVVSILREIKTSWKLFLNGMEVFLENLTENLDDEALIASANWLHRKFLLMIDYSERQLNYHSRFVTYLANAPVQKGLCIHPSTFVNDLLQEKDAIAVVCSRLTALRTRTSAVLDTAMNLNAIKQAELSQKTMELQRKDAELAFHRNEGIKRLNIVSIMYLPATFIASVYGMNISENNEPKLWTLWSFVIVASILTIVTLVVVMRRAGFRAVSGAKAYLQHQTRHKMREYQTRLGSSAHVENVEVPTNV